MVSNDVQRFEDAAPFIHFLWLGPVEVILSTYFIWLQISWAAFAAVGALLLLIPIQGWFAGKFGKIRKETVMHRDDRVRSISDLFSGINVVKLYAWEKPFTESINKVRDEELHYIRQAAKIRAINEAFWFSSSALVSAFGFLAFWLIGGTFTPARIFSTITLLMNIRLSMTNFFPKAFQFTSESMVSFSRIQKFLLLPEVSEERTKKMDPTLLTDDNTIIRFEHATYSWDAPSMATTSGDESQMKPILIDLNLSIRESELVFVVGPVGAGKTSFAYALLGEMSLVSGKYAMRDGKSVAYVSQTAWIINGTVLENILFGRAYDAAWFEQVIRACAMEHDLGLFPDREQTVLGERGVNLSGGQRARLTLARAVYSKADIYSKPLQVRQSSILRFSSRWSAECSRYQGWSAYFRPMYQWDSRKQDTYSDYASAPIHGT